MYKSESILGLVGSILSSICAFFILAGTLLGAFYFNMFTPFLQRLVDTYAAPWGWTFDAAMQLALPAFIVIAAVWFVLAAASLILGFLGTAKLKGDDKNGGVLLIIAGALSFFSVFSFIQFVLFIVGGIMAVSKKQPPAEIAPQGQVNGQA
ncbi:MAG: DUF4064 domain-containing protein [Burkholderiales bacterium]